MTELGQPSGPGDASGETNLTTLLRTMRPEMQQDAYVFLTFNGEPPPALVLGAWALVREAEGPTLMVKESASSDLAGALPRWALITLTVHSSLEAVGFLAALSTALAKEGISTNAISAYFHDHLFVPWERRGDALAVLKSLAAPGA